MSAQCKDPNRTSLTKHTVTYIMHMRVGNCPWNTKVLTHVAVGGVVVVVAIIVTDVTVHDWPNTLLLLSLIQIDHCSVPPQD